VVPQGKKKRRKERLEVIMKCITSVKEQDTTKHIETINQRRRGKEGKEVQ
jgi:hypothetical protein